MAEEKKKKNKLGVIFFKLITLGGLILLLLKLLDRPKRNKLDK